MKTILITCDLCDKTTTNYLEYPGVGKFQTHKLFVGDVCDGCYEKIINDQRFKDLMKSLKNKEV